MKLLYVNVIEQNAGWGAEWFMNSAFQTLGHNTYCLDYRKNRHSLYDHFMKIPPCDVFFLQRGDHFPLAIVRSVRTPRVFWTSELVARCRDHDHLLQSGLFDHIFMRTQSCIDAVISTGRLQRGQCSVLLSAFDEKTHRPISDESKDIDILFAGSVSARRKIILDRLSEIHKVTIASAFGEEMVKLINRAKVVLNIHGGDFLDTETRVYEVLGCGAFLLTEKLSPENPFSCLDLAQFDSFDDLVDKVRYYLAHDEEREAIAEHGHRSALDGHTYAHRAQQIIDTISSYLKPNQPSGPMIRHSADLYTYAVSEKIQRLRNSPKLDRFKKPIKAFLHRQL
jgi:hypothetical protein